MSDSLDRLLEAQRRLAEGSPSINRLLRVQSSLAASLPFIERMVEIQDSITAISPGFSRNLIGVHKAVTDAIVIGGVLKIPAFESLGAIIGNAISQAVDLKSFEITAPLEGLLQSLIDSSPFEDTGWFPHHTFPMHLLEDFDEAVELDAAVSEYYVNNWSNFKESVEEDLCRYDVSELSKTTLRQAVTAFERGLYALICPSLFAQIERVVRVELCQDKIGPISVNREVEQQFGDAPLSAFKNIPSPLLCYELAVNHLYGNIRNEADRERFMNEDIPNRHGVIHGLLDYPTRKNCLNIIFIADFFYRMTTKIVELRVKCT